MSIPQTLFPPAVQQGSISQLTRRSESSSCQSQPSPIYSARGLQRGRTTTLLVNRRSSSIQDKSLVVLPARHIETTHLDRSSLYRLNEKLVRRSVRAEEEPGGQIEDKQRKANTADHHLWRARVQNMQTTAQIFCSTLFWIVLFFIATIWDGENSGKRPRK